jgi:hypothetical protein
MTVKRTTDDTGTVRSRADASPDQDRVKTAAARVEIA